jgi:hypothetical protein
MYGFVETTLVNYSDCNGLPCTLEFERAHPMPMDKEDRNEWDVEIRKVVFNGKRWNKGIPVNYALDVYARIPLSAAVTKVTEIDSYIQA